MGPGDVIDVARRRLTRCPMSASHPISLSTTPGLEPDSTLLDAWRRGDEQAGTRLLTRLAPRLSSFFRGRGSRAPEDLVQETLVAFWLGCRRVRDPRAVHGYLQRIARRKLQREHQRDLRRDVVRNELALRDTATHTNADRVDATALLDRMDPAAAELLTAYYLLGFRARELAEAHRVPESTLRARLRTGLSRARREVHEPRDRYIRDPRKALAGPPRLDFISSPADSSG